MHNHTHAKRQTLKRNTRDQQRHPYTDTNTQNGQLPPSTYRCIHIHIKIKMCVHVERETDIDHKKRGHKTGSFSMRSVYLIYKRRAQTDCKLNVSRLPMTMGRRCRSYTLAQRKVNHTMLSELRIHKPSCGGEVTNSVDGCLLLARRLHAAYLTSSPKAPQSIYLRVEFSRSPFFPLHVSRFSVVTQILAIYSICFFHLCSTARASTTSQTLPRFFVFVPFVWDM